MDCFQDAAERPSGAGAGQLSLKKLRGCGGDDDDYSRTTAQPPPAAAALFLPPLRPRVQQHRLLPSRAASSRPLGAASGHQDGADTDQINIDALLSAWSRLLQSKRQIQMARRRRR
ncbi:hypothetical protein P7K49_025354 [Saguinus oedipus]|uniref:Uncharacterized protein n=1 Tax=Saguinus oedipus TaxID=9490 RepID=A0ABQ9UGZ3_SAGOE|nr:hypothetical protein P7K49_025354 [Saguinus oedipus]